jgi:hypothetical protein
MRNSTSHLDAFNLLCGRQIGSGMTRRVFECGIDPKKYVVKVESEDVRSHFQNIIEWYVWGRVAGTEFEKWFAPVHEMAPDGRCLIMHRTTPLDHTQLPDKMPAFFTDFKPANYGMYKGHVVCHDYGTNLLIERGLTKAMKTVDWNL